MRKQLRLAAVLMSTACAGGVTDSAQPLANHVEELGFDDSLPVDQTALRGTTRVSGLEPRSLPATAVVAGVCGNAVCDEGETCSSCEFDCGSCGAIEVTFEIRLILEGAFDSETGLMRDRLRQLGRLPAESPFAEWDSSYWESSFMPNSVPDEDGNGTPDLFEVEGPNAIVDWVWVEVRNSFEGEFPSEHEADAFMIAPALLQRDGDIVGPNGDPLEFDGLPGGHDFAIYVGHLNHLPTISASIDAPEDNATIIVDLTNSGETPYVGAPRKEVAESLFAVQAGNALLGFGDWSVNEITGADRAIWSELNGLWSDYLYTLSDGTSASADFNLDGSTDGADRALWSANNGLFTTIPASDD